jgi:hypothetical protein
MAVGARITSENLSGKTATVTFTPYTGQTSGSTVNLGTKTIPFNNINIHPYGVYNLYFAEYDYTYTLNIPEPVTDSQLYVYVSKMVNDNNYGAATLNFNDFTATVIDLNVDTNEYYIDDLYPLTNSGYGYHFRRQDNNGIHLIIFTDASNTEIGRYTTPTPTSDTEFNDLDGRWITFIDFDLGVFKYSNGVDVYTYEYDGSRYTFDIQWDYDATMSDTSFIVIKYDMGQGIDHHAVKFNADGTQTTLKSWTNNDYIDYNFQLQFNNDIFVIENYDTDNGQYRSIEICGLDGTVLETVVLGGAIYTCKDYGFYGDNKYFVSFYSCNDYNLDYKIIQYNFNTTTLIETSHVRGTEYSNFSWRSDSNFWPNENLTENLVLTFHSNWGNWTSFGPPMDYVDFMYIFGNQSSFTTYQFTNGATVNIWPWLDQSGSNMFRGRCNTGDAVASVFTITSGTTHIESLGVNIDNIYNDNYWNIDDRTVYGFYTDQDYTGFTMTLIGLTGGTQDTKNLTFSGAWGDNQSRSQYKTFYFGANTVANGNEGWYINDNTTGFTSTGYYYWQSNSDQFYTPTFLENSNLVLYHYGNNVARVLTSTGISQEFSLSAWNNNKNIEVGDNMFMHIYDDGNNYYHVKLYDFEGTLLNTLDTTFTNYDESSAVKDRFVVRFYNNDTETYVMYMISANSIQSVSLADFNTYDIANDYIWWD